MDGAAAAQLLLQMDADGDPVNDTDESESSDDPCLSPEKEDDLDMIF